jgi:hypothetical protein
MLERFKRLGDADGRSRSDVMQEAMLRGLRILEEERAERLARCLR